MSTRKYKIGRTIKNTNAIMQEGYVIMRIPSFKNGAFYLTYKTISTKWIRNMNFSLVMFRLKCGDFFKAIRIKENTK